MKTRKLLFTMGSAVAAIAAPVKSIAVKVSDNLFGTENLKVLGGKVLPILKNYLKLPKLVADLYDASRVDVIEGATISVKRPVVFAAKDFTGAIELQDISRRLVDIKLKTFKDISFALDTQEITFIMTGNKKVVELLAPAMSALSDSFDAEMVKLYKGIYNHTGDAAKAFTTVADYLAGRTAMNLRHVPQQGRKAIFGAEASAQLLSIDTFLDADKSGSTDALREASIGRTFGFENFEISQDIQHVVGAAITSAADVTKIVTSAESTETEADDNQDIVNVESTNFALAALGTGDIEVGDRFTIIKDAKPYQFVVKEKVTAAGNAAAVKASPIYRDADGDVIKFAAASEVKFAGDVTGSYDQNIMLHPSAFGFAPVSLGQIPNGAGAIQQTITADGLSFRMTTSYDFDAKKQLFSIDALAGFAVLYPQLAEIVIGGR